MLSSYDRDTRQLVIILDAGKFSSTSYIKFRSAYKNFLGSDVDIITCDLRNVRSIDEDGMDIIAHLRNSFRDRTRIELCNASPQVKRWLLTNSIDRRIKVS